MLLDWCGKKLGECGLVSKASWSDCGNDSVRSYKGIARSKNRCVTGIREKCSEFGALKLFTDV